MKQVLLLVGDHKHQVYDIAKEYTMTEFPYGSGRYENIEVWMIKAIDNTPIESNHIQYWRKEVYEKVKGSVFIELTDKNRHLLTFL